MTLFVGHTNVARSVHLGSFDRWDDEDTVERRLVVNQGAESNAALEIFRNLRDIEGRV